MNRIVVPQDSPTADFLAMMASGYDSGLILCCGESLYDHCLKMSQAMPMTAKLVLNVETDQGFKNSNLLTAKDIRVAVHKQDYVSFLDDISRYFFNLIILENNQNLNPMISSLLDKLMPGGFIVVLNAELDDVKSGLPDAGWCSLDMMWSDKAVLIRAASEHAQPTIRKGGRRAKIRAS